MIQHSHWLTTPLHQIISEFAGLKVVDHVLIGDPLDDDDVDGLVDILRVKINLHQGNITDEEYQEEMAKLLERKWLPCNRANDTEEVEV